MTRRPSEGVEKLLIIARHNAHSLRADLAEAERAQSAADASLIALDESVRLEGAAGARPEDMARYVEGVRLRRIGLKTNSLSLAKASDAIRERLELAAKEIQKLEHVIALAAAARAKADKKREARLIEEIAARIKRA